MSRIEKKGQWYAVHTRAHFEQVLASALDGRAIETFYPVFEQRHRWADRQKLISSPVFPGYLFVRIAGTADERVSILQARGAVRILGPGNAIEPIPEIEIEAIRRLLASKASCYPHAFLREGMRVRVRRGALKHLTGILVRFRNQARIVISVQLLQQAIAADLDVDDVEVLNAGGERDGMTAALAARSADARR
jgi:transcription antitermination factor NusG